MKIEEFDYDLPTDLIAQSPEKQRDECRLMILNRRDDSIADKHFKDIIEYLNRGDCLVMNDSKVIPARLLGTKKGTGTNAELLLSRRIEGDVWESLVRPGRRLKLGDRVIFGHSNVKDEENQILEAEIIGYGDDGTRKVRFYYDGIFAERLADLGQMPLPPYIERAADENDKQMYQTVYAKYDGSVAAPTAGLHFTKDLLKKIEEKGVKLAYLTLHVGIGTFRPVKCEKIEDHHMHFESYFVSGETAKTINETIMNGGRIVSVGTTSTRTLESCASYDESAGRYFVKSGEGDTGIFIYPGYEYKIIDALITNFHLPKSTLIMLVSALYDREHILKAYRLAVDKGYRFFSYGDAMFIE